MAKAAQKDVVDHAPRRRGGRPRLDAPNPVDVHVGARVRLRRNLLGMSQEKLGNALGLTFQQVQKYERGANRIGASRLYDVAKALDVPVAWLFDEMDEKAIHRGDDAHPDDTMARRETLELVRAYYAIKDPNVRKSLYTHVKALGAQ